MTRDMTSGHPLKVIIPFFLSMTAANFFSQLYHVVDTMVVGRCLGSNALASVGACGAIQFLFNGGIIGFPVGLSIITGQRCGAKDADGVRRSVCVSLIINFCVLVLLELFGLTGLESLLYKMDTPPELIQNAYDYFFIIILGMPWLAFYMLFSAQMRALGDSRRPVYVIIGSSTLNGVLDWLFVSSFNWGIKGAAWATVVSQVLSAFACLLFIRYSLPELHPHRSSWRNPFKLYWKHLALAFPLALQFSIMGFGSLVLQTAFNRFGEDLVAASTAASRLDAMVWIPFLSLGATVSAYSAQNFGAKRFDRIRQGLRYCGGAMFFFSVVIAAVCIVFYHPLLRIFLNEADLTPVILDGAKTLIYSVSPFYPMLGLIVIYRNALQGMGYSMLPLIGGILETAGRIFAAVYLAKAFGYQGVCFASALVWTSNGLLMYVVYVVVLRQLMKKQKAQNLEKMG